MTSPNLDRSQRRQIKKIANDWKRGEIESPAHLYNRVKDELPDLWPQYKNEVKAELDRAMATPSWQDRVQKAGGLILRSLLYLVALLILFFILVESVAVSYLLKDELRGLAVAVAEQIVPPAAEPAGPGEIEGAILTSTVAPTNTSAPSSPVEATAIEPPTLTPTLTPIIEPTPTSAVTIFGTVTVEDTDQVNWNEAKLVLSSGKEGSDERQEDKTQLAGGRRDFQLTAQTNEELRYFHLEVDAPWGAYVRNITPGDSNWQVITNPVTGLVSGLKSQQALAEATVSDVQVILSVVPTTSVRIAGQYQTGSFRHPDPYNDDLNRKKGDITESVTILGQWADDGAWHLACGQPRDHPNDQECFWTRTGEDEQGRLRGVTVASEQPAQLPTIYLPTGERPLVISRTGWVTQEIDGLAILSSQKMAATQPVTLEWHIDNVQNWFQLEAWAPRGSQETTYQVIALVNNQEINLGPLRGTRKVEAVPQSEMSAFRGIGNYHLNAEGTIVVRLWPKPAGVKTGFIRLLKPTPEPES